MLLESILSPSISFSSRYLKISRRVSSGKVSMRFPFGLVKFNIEWFEPVIILSMLSRKDSQRKLRSEARFLKLRLQELFPQELCKRHRKRNWLISRYEQRQKEIAEKENKQQRQTIAGIFYKHECHIEKQPLRLKNFFKKDELEQILDEKHYYFGDEEKYRELTNHRDRPPRSLEYRVKTSSQVKHSQPSELLNTSSNNYSRQKTFQAVKKTEVFDSKENSPRERFL